MSPRAAWRLEMLGFRQVFTYSAGKADWFASELPRAGKLAAVPRAGDVARRDVPTCRVDEPVGDVQRRVQAAGWTECIVATERGVVLGRLRQQALGRDPAATVETAMEEGPTTIRPDTLLEEITPRMHEGGVESILITTADGRLVGVLYRQDAEHHLQLGDWRAPG